MKLLQEIEALLTENQNPSLIVHGPRHKLWRGLLQAKIEKVETLDRFIEIVQRLGIPECTFRHLQSLINKLRKKGFETSYGMDDITFKTVIPRQPLKFDLNLEDIYFEIGQMSGVVQCSSVLALCGLKPQQMLQIERVTGHRIHFTNPQMSSREIPSCFQGIVEEFVTEQNLEAMINFGRSTGDPRLDRTNLSNLFCHLKKGEVFPYNLGQLRYTGGVICLVNGGLNAIDEMADMLDITIRSAHIALNRWIEKGNITQETANKIYECQH